MRDNVTIEELISIALDNFAVELHTSMPCIVKQVNPDGTVDAFPVINKVLRDRTEVEISVIPDVPVLQMGNDQFAISFPVSIGDEGLLIFSERDISRFVKTGKSSAPVVLRKHDFSDAIFLPVGISNAKRMTPPATDGLVLEEKTGKARIELKAGKITLSGDVYFESVAGSGNANVNLNLHTHPSDGTPPQ